MKVKVIVPFYSTETGLAKVDDILEVKNSIGLEDLVKAIPDEQKTEAEKKETKKAKQA